MKESVTVQFATTSFEKRQYFCTYRLFSSNFLGKMYSGWIRAGKASYLGRAGEEGEEKRNIQRVILRTRGIETQIEEKGDIQ